MDWKQYEGFTKYIYETLGKESGVEVISYGNNCIVRGKSKVNHQIDVLTRHSDGLHSYRTAIECKYWEKKINKDIVMKVSDVIEDTGIEKGVIVSKKGFTPDGIKFAKYKNIGLVELREADSFDDPDETKIGIKTAVVHPMITSIGFIYEEEDKTELISFDDAVIHYPDKSITPFNTLIDIFKFKLRSQTPGFEFEMQFDLHGAKLIDNSNNTESTISKVSIRGILNRIESDLSYLVIDRVYLIMEVHFENSLFTISKLGKIKKSTLPNTA